jgi:hypothetical protein
MTQLSAAAAAALLASAALAMPAFAGQPTLSGTYLLHERLVCQANESITQSGKKFQFTATSPGNVGLAIGTITFTPASDGALNGKVKATTSNVDGSLLISTVDGVTTGTPMTLSQANKLSGKYTINANIIEVKFKGQPTLDFDSVFGQVDSSAVAGTVDGVAVNASPSDCSSILRLDRQ